MFSRRTQPIMEDIVSVFESTQNQPWSVFSGKLNSISIGTCKRKNIFKSENPIRLSLKNDYRVFGLIPRLEEFKLVSCRKCKMIVKEDCLLHHYNRRHNSGNDTFSLKGFLRPTINSNKHKRQKLNVRKLTKNKLMNGKIIDPVIQEIKTEFDELEFERLSKIKLQKIESKTKVGHNDNNDLNFVIETCSLSNNDVFDWNIEPYSKSLIPYYVDNKIKEFGVESSNVSVEELLNDREKLHIQKYINYNNSDNTIKDVNSSRNLLEKPLILNDKIKHDMLSNLANENEVNNKSKISYCKVGGVLNNKNITFERDYNLDVIDDDKLFNDVITQNPNLINLTTNEKIELISCYNYDSVINNDKSSCDSITNSHPSLNNEDNVKIPPNAWYCNTPSNENKNYEIYDPSEDYGYELETKKTNNTSSNKNSDITSDDSSLNISLSQSTGLVNIKKENTCEIYEKYLDIADKIKIEHCQLSIESPINKTLTKSSPPSSTYLKSTNDQLQSTSQCVNSTVTSNNSSSILLCNIKEEFKPTQINKYTVDMYNEYSDSDVTSDSQSLDTPLIDIIKSTNSSLLTACKKYEVGDNCSYHEYYHTCKFASYEEEINDSLNNYSILSSESQNFNKKTKVSPINIESAVDINNKNVDDIFSIFNESTTAFIDSPKEPKLKSRFDYSINMMDDDSDSQNETNDDDSDSQNETNDDDSDSQNETNDENKCYYLSEFINSNVSSSLILNNYDYSDTSNDDSDTSDDDSDDSETSYDQSSVSSLDINDETHDSLSSVTYSNSMSDESFDSDASQSTSESFYVVKDTKSTQTDSCLDHEDYELPVDIDLKSKIGESLLQLLDNIDNNFNCAPTDRFVNYEEVSNNRHISVNSSSNDEITKNALNNCIPVKSSPVVSESSVNGFTSVSSSAKIINNTIIPMSTEKYELTDTDVDYDTSNSSHDTLYFQQIPRNLENQTDQFTNNPTHSPIIENNDKVYNSEPCTDKQSDIIHLKTSGLRYHPLFIDCLKKNTDKNNVPYVKNYKIDNTLFKIKKNLKRHSTVKIADDKENNHKLWKYDITINKRPSQTYHFIKRFSKKYKHADKSEYNDPAEK